MIKEIITENGDKVLIDTDAIERNMKKWGADCGGSILRACEEFEKHGEKLRQAIENDAVNHPAHYCTGQIEVIDYIEDKGFPYHLGNAVKYISRAGRKDPEKTVEDLRKAVWYIERYIKLLESEAGHVPD